jgi:hypothetical protein
MKKKKRETRMNDGFPAAIISLYKEAKNGINTSAVKKETRPTEEKKKLSPTPHKINCSRKRFLRPELRQFEREI